MTRLQLPVQATAQKPEKTVTGFFAAVGAGFLLALLYVASAQTEKEAIKAFTVQMDTRDFYDGEKVRLNVTREPVCGTESWTGQGVKGRGILDIEKGVEPMPVVVEPCMTNGPVVKLPDGRVLHLTEAKAKEQ